jgi:hypothetical protein
MIWALISHENFGPPSSSGSQACRARALVQRGLRRIVTKTKPGAPFKLRRASFKGKGLQAAARGGSWTRLRDLAYEGRGA